MCQNAENRQMISRPLREQTISDHPRNWRAGRGETDGAVPADGRAPDRKGHNPLDRARPVSVWETVLRHLPATRRPPCEVLRVVQRAPIVPHHGGCSPTIHDLRCQSSARRGWRAFGRHECVREDALSAGCKSPSGLVATQQSKVTALPRGGVGSNRR